MGSASVPDPFIESWSPVFDHVAFSEFNSLSVAESTLGFCSSYHVDCVEVDLDPFFRVGSGLGLRTPGTAIDFVSDPRII